MSNDAQGVGEEELRPLRKLAVRTRFQAAAAHALTPLVGRDDELAVLSSHLERAGRGKGQVVLISGEADIGKSRLLLEFQRSLAPDGVRWLEGRCISFGRNISYLPLTDMLKQAFGIEEGDSAEAIIARVDEASAGWEAPHAQPFPNSSSS